MREFSVPALFDTPATGNLTDFIVSNAREAPDHAVFSSRVGSSWQDVTARQFLDEVAALARGLLAAGIGPGDRVGLMSRTRYEWTLIDFAIWSAGAVTVPIYETSSAEQVQWILNDSGAVACFVESAEHQATRGLGPRRAARPAPRLADRRRRRGRARRRGRRRAGRRPVDARRTTAGPDDPATIIYTSGTTGRPKGCELTHRNFFADAATPPRAAPVAVQTRTAPPCSSCRWPTCSPG